MYNRILLNHKKKWLPNHKETWVNLKYILLSERSPSKRSTYSLITIICHSGKGKKISVVAGGSGAKSRVEVSQGIFGTMKQF